MLKNQQSRAGMDSGRSVTSAVLRSRRERICDTVCDMHECVLSGCVGAESAGYLMDRLLSLEPRDT